jgi:hypothetical protein
MLKINSDYTCLILDLRSMQDRLDSQTPEWRATKAEGAAAPL